MSRRRKKKAARKLAQAAAAAMRGADPSQGPAVAPGPYQFVYVHVGRLRDADIKRALHDEPRLFRRIAFASQSSPDAIDPQVGWNLLKAYCDAVEAKMASILASHSVYYWLYLYRRLGVKLDPRHDNKTDARTVGLVRLTLEAGIQKYGRLDCVDVVAPTSMPLNQWFGGVLRKAFVALVGESEADAAMNRVCGRAADTIPAEFTEDTLVDLYRLEGYAYEYWYITALMRTVGKGGTLRIDDAGPDVDRTIELDELIRSYDMRIDERHSPSSNIGVAFPGNPKDEFAALAPVYNVQRIPPGFPPEDAPFCVPEGEATNFIVVPIQIGAFLEAHRFASESFRVAKGFRLSSLCAVLAGISWKDFAGRLRDGRLDINGAYNLWQRGYAFASRQVVEEELIPWTAYLMRNWRPADAVYVQPEGRAILTYLTLDAAKQKYIGLWSRGPLYPLIPYGDRYLVDVASIAHRLNNEFFGVRHDQQAKGPIFEDTFRAAVREAGLDLLPERELRYSDVERREVDAAVRLGDTLVVCDCKAMERPLNFELGSTSTINTRCTEFDKKVEQVFSLADFLRRRPSGRTYDYSWARDIVPLVVSPFIEWIWSRDSRLWVAPNTPRILSLSEAINFLKTFAVRPETQAQAR